jgi:hypothetical protein
MAGFFDSGKRPRLVRLPRGQDKLGVAAWQPQSRLADPVITPSQFMAQRIAIEAESRVKIRDRDSNRSDLLQQGARY